MNKKAQCVSMSVIILSALDLYARAEQQGKTCDNYMSISNENKTIYMTNMACIQEEKK